MVKNTFRTGSGCYKCESCGKLTRDTGNGESGTYCLKCVERMEHENSHADLDFPNDDCGYGDKCPVKHYTKEERWWLK